MDKAHDVESVSFHGNKILLRVDGKDYEVEVTLQSQLLASATRTQQQNFVVSPSGYGIHWPDLDEDLSVDGLIGVRHSPPIHKKEESDKAKDSPHIVAR
jgi:hypothetical protein